VEKTLWTPADLLQLSGGYWNACALHAGVKLDIFTQLADRSFTAEELAGNLESDVRGTRMLLNSLTALELIEKRGDSYISTPFAAKYLSRTSAQYLGHIILHHRHLMASWSRLDAAVISGNPDMERVSLATDGEVQENFEMGMFNLAMQTAPLLVPQIDLTGRRRLLDLGGGPGTYAIHFCTNNPHLSAVVYDLPTTRPFAEQTIARFGLSDRIAFVAGDFMNNEIEGRYDAAWLSHILHGAGPEGSAVILEKAVAALGKGGLIMVQEFILDDNHCSPLFPALFSLNMLLGTPTGHSYSQSELFEMMAVAGVRDLRRHSLDLPNGAGVIVGTIP
jgi:SAM-dependent methyltransferase